jgi:hypothetical protein
MPPYQGFWVCTQLRGVTAHHVLQLEVPCSSHQLVATICYGWSIDVDLGPPSPPHLGANGRDGAPKYCIPIVRAAMAMPTTPLLLQGAGLAGC